MSSADVKKKQLRNLKKGWKKTQENYEKLRRKRSRLILKLVKESPPCTITENDLYDIIKKEYDETISKIAFKKIIQDLKTEKKLSDRFSTARNTGKWKLFLVLLE